MAFKIRKDMTTAERVHRSRLDQRPMQPYEERWEQRREIAWQIDQKMGRVGKDSFLVRLDSLSDKYGDPVRSMDDGLSMSPGKAKQVASRFVRPMLSYERGRKQLDAEMLFEMKENADLFGEKDYDFLKGMSDYDSLVGEEIIADHVNLQQFNRGNFSVSDKLRLFPTLMSQLANNMVGKYSEQMRDAVEAERSNSWTMRREFYPGCFDVSKANEAYIEAKVRKAGTRNRKINPMAEAFAAGQGGGEQAGRTRADARADEIRAETAAAAQAKAAEAENQRIRGMARDDVRSQRMTRTMSAVDAEYAMAAMKNPKLAHMAPGMGQPEQEEPIKVDMDITVNREPGQNQSQSTHRPTVAPRSPLAIEAPRQVRPHGARPYSAGELGPGPSASDPEPEI